MEYQPTNRSLRRHVVPDWFHDAKLGIFVHWGLYSVPGWAPLVGDITEVIAEVGWSGAFARYPYAEWYWNTLRIEGSETAEHHAQTYDDGVIYPDLAPRFDQATASFDPAVWADLFARAGARYVVLTTKHHDGYTLWPSAYPNPYVEDWHSSRDLVGEVTQTVRARGMRMGLYYSGGLDWSFEPRAIRDLVDLIGTMPQSPLYVEYVANHWRELIARHRPAVLWNDIGYPARLDIKSLYADYYNAVPDGVVNDRAVQANLGALPKSRIGRAVLRLVLGLAMRSFVVGRMPRMAHADFSTPEYASLAQTVDYKWEATRGIGTSFGYKRNETAEHMLSVEELVRSFVDIVSKNGNLLLNVGPMADGTIPALQEERLLGLGAWLAVNGEAIYGTRPWLRAEGTTSDGVPVRFTRKDRALYAVLFGPRGGREVRLSVPGLAPGATVGLLGHDVPLGATCGAGELVVTWPERLPPSPAHTLKIEPIG